MTRTVTDQTTASKTGQGEGIRLPFPLTASAQIVEEGLDLLAQALRIT